jgi:hypothetical protein
MSSIRVSPLRRGINSPSPSSTNRCFTLPTEIIFICISRKIAGFYGKNKQLGALKKILKRSTELTDHTEAEWILVVGQGRSQKGTDGFVWCSE